MDNLLLCAYNPPAITTVLIYRFRVRLDLGYRRVTSLQDVTDYFSLLIKLQMKGIYS